MNSYEKLWAKIDSLLNKAGQAKTALNEVNTLYTKAKTESNDPQLIKSLIYRATLTAQLSDDDKNSHFSLLEKEITEAKEPARSILQSILANSYQNFLQRNRYRFGRRTNTVNFRKEGPCYLDIRRSELKNIFPVSFFHRKQHAAAANRSASI